MKKEDVFVSLNIKMFMQLMLAFLLSNIHAKDLVCRFLATEESYANPIYKRKSVMKPSTADRHVYLAGQDGLEHHIVSSKHRSEFHPIKVKPTSQSLAIQRLMMWYIFSLHLFH
jgi:hypothetical protein